MKTEGFKYLKRKEGLSFYLKGFHKNKPFKEYISGVEQNHIDTEDDYESDLGGEAVVTDLINNSVLNKNIKHTSDQ